MSKMYDNITGRSPIATDDLGYIGTGNKASDILNNGTTDYNDLNNKPTINNVELKGDLTSSDLGLQPKLNESQTNAVNSGITDALTEQISTNKDNILLIGGTGTKYNLSTVATGTVSGADYIIPLTDITMPIGEYVVKWTGEATTGQCAIAINDSGGNRLITQTVNNVSDVIQPITINGVGKQFSLYCNVANTITNFCIIPKQLYDAGFNYYQPYCMSIAEMSAWILSQS